MTQNDPDVWRRIVEAVERAAAPHCSEPGCSAPRRVRQYCFNHYAGLRRRGTVPKGEPIFKVSKPQKHIAWLVSAEASECLIWPHLVSQGYGIVSFKHHVYRAHRLVCEAAHGPGPEGKEAAHECGNALCCNKAHLSWKTHAENIADKVKHGTQMLGETHHQAKLTESQVQEIRKLRGKRTRLQLASDFDVGRSTVDNVLDYVTWRHVA